MTKLKKAVALALCSIMVLVSCKTASSVTKQEATDNLVPVDVAEETLTSAYAGLKRTVAIARFSNETTYAKGAFYDRENDPMQKQAMDILNTKLQNSGKFILLERSDLNLVEKEQIYGGVTPETVGAEYLIIGSITKYGRKTEGVTASVFGGSKKQIVEAAVSIRLVDVATGQIIYADEGAAEAEMISTNILGFGTVANYDSTLADKAIEGAIESLISSIEKNCTDIPWKTYIISNEDDTIIIGGGESQGIKAGDVFNLVTVGKRIKNPQTGLYIILEGEKVGMVQVVRTMGAGLNEYSIVKLTAGSLDGDISKYEVQEIRK